MASSQPPADPAPAEGLRRSPARILALNWLHLAVLWSFAFAQPLFKVLAGDPAFFVARGDTRGDILILAFGVTLVPPTVLVAAEALLTRVPAAMRALHLAFFGLLAALFALQVIADAAPGGSSFILIPLSLALGAAAAAAYRLTRVVPSMLTVLSPAPVVFLAIFLLFSNVSKLVLPEKDVNVQASVGGRSPVVFVLLDEFSGLNLLDRDGNINSRRFPHIAALERTSHWYRNATTISDQTSRAVPAILTGKRPNGKKLPIVSDYPKNLFTLLGGDYRLNVHETASHLCPDDLCHRQQEPIGTRLRSLGRDLRTVALRRLLPDDLGRGLPAVNRTFGNFQSSAKIYGGVVKGADQAAPQARGQSFESFIRGIKDGRTLNFLHILLPHIPWTYLPTGQQYAENGPIPGLDDDTDGWRKDSGSLPQQAEQRYLLQAQYVDGLIGRLMADLRRRGLFDRSLVIVMADHGVAFRAGDYRRRVTQSNFAQLASIPLFIKHPGERQGRVEESPAISVDVLPTLADLLDTKLPWATDGSSLKDGPAPSRDTLRVNATKGPEVQRSFPGYIRQRNLFAAQDVRLFGSGDHSLFAPPAEAGLIGRSTSAFPVTRRPGAKVRLDSSQSFRSINPTAPLLQAFVTGQVSGVGADEKLAVAVNGRIEATTHSFRETGQVSFSAVVPPASFRKGANSVRLFAVRGSGAQVALESLGEAASLGYDLIREDGREVLKSKGGKAVVVPNSVGGYLEVLNRFPGGITIRGWAALESHAADRVVVYLNGRLLTEGEPTKDRDDVAKDFGGGARKSGFQLSGNLPAGTKAPAANVRAFGIYGKRAAELTKLRSVK